MESPRTRGAGRCPPSGLLGPNQVSSADFSRLEGALGPLVPADS